MVMIGGKLVNYKFGPPYDMDIRFSATFQMQAGRSYDECSNGSQLILQLLCHAVQQVQSAEERNWTLERIEEIDTWDYPTEQTIKEDKPVHVANPMTYAKYQIKAYGRLVLTLRESFECDYVIEYYEPTDGEWLDQFFDYAQEHCERFGRM